MWAVRYIGNKRNYFDYKYVMLYVIKTTTDNERMDENI